MVHIVLQSLSSISKYLSGVFPFVLRNRTPIILFIPAIILAFATLHLSRLATPTTWLSFASTTLVLAATYLSLRIIISLIFTPILTLIRDTEAYWLLCNVYIPRYLPFICGITATVAAVFGGCGVAYVARELSPDMTLFIVVVWASVVPAIVHREDITTVARFLESNHWWIDRLRVKGRRVLIVLIVFAAFTISYSFLSETARGDPDAWVVVTLGWGIVGSCLISGEDWEPYKSRVGKWWGSVVLLVMTVAVLRAGGYLTRVMEEYHYRMAMVSAV